MLSVYSIMDNKPQSLSVRYFDLEIYTPLSLRLTGLQVMKMTFWDIDTIATVYISVQYDAMLYNAANTILVLI